jgi:CRP-like cAMP-binding protein
MVPLPTVDYKRGSYITIENAPNPGRFYIIIEGKAQVSKNHSPVQDRKSTIIGPGDAFAVVACLTGHNESETVQAQSDMRLLVVERSRFAELVENNMKTAMKIIMQLTASIRMLNAVISSISLFGKIKREVENKDTAPRLYRVGEFYQSNGMFNQAYYAYHRCVQNYPGFTFSDVAKENMEKIKTYVTQEKFDYLKADFKRIYPKNAMLFAESEPGKELFFILKGRVKVSRIENNKEVTLALLKAGDVCGKISMLEGLPHATNAMSLEECHTLAVGPAGFETVMKSQPQLLVRLSSILAEQVWFLNKQVLNRSLRDPLDRLYDMLAVMLEKERVTGEKHQFCFGISELVDMAGYTQEACGNTIKKLLSESLIGLDENGEIQVISSAGIIRKNDTIWKEPVLCLLD